jgi:hypothetical protein
MPLSPADALGGGEAATPFTGPERRVLQPLRGGGVCFARYLPPPLIAKQFDRRELVHLLSTLRLDGVWGICFAPLGGHDDR